MGTRHPNPRKVKIHRNYTVDELARVLGLHKNTVRRWERIGLTPLDNGRPKLFAGDETRRFLTKRRQDARQPCPPGFMFCLGCRAPRTPAGDVADLLPINATSANLRGLCHCGALMHRRVSMAKLDQVRGNLEVTVPLASARLRDSDQPSPNGAFAEDDKG